MSLGEFDLIQRFFAAQGRERPDVLLGVGDDAALLRPPVGMDLAVTQDTLVESVHFLAGTDPARLGHKSLAVNLSDLAAMGADPAWFTLALTLPGSDPDWLRRFSAGLGQLAVAEGVRLVGGDTTRGPLAISITALGWVPAGQALRRDGARIGDQIAVTGTLGDAGLALTCLLGGVAPPDDQLERLERPWPRIAAGQALRGLASAAIDISDGLAADLGHILERSSLGASVRLAALPCSPPVAVRVGSSGDWSLPLASGDDYELCFTLPPGHLAEAKSRLAGLACPLTVIGEIEATPGLRLLEPDGRAYRPTRAGYNHFAAHD